MEWVQAFTGWLAESLEWKSLWPALFGAAGGAAVSVGYARRASLKTRMIEQITSYQQEVVPKEPHALGSLIHGVPKGQGARARVEEVRLVGNWFDAYAALALSGALDKRLRERFGVDPRALNFWREFQKSSLNGNGISPKDWQNLDEFAGPQRSWWERLAWWK